MNIKKGKVSIYFLLLFIGIILGGIFGSEFVKRISNWQEISDSNDQLKSGIDQNNINNNSLNNIINTNSEILYTRKNAIVNATQLIEPCVVGIVVTQVQMIVGNSYSYEDFFDLFFGPRLEPRIHEFENMGSGFVIHKNGLILTNNHVVEGAKKLYINFPDGRQFEGKIVGADHYSDLAVVAVSANGENFKNIKFGNSEELLIGEWVIAIGNPFLNFFNDAQPTVTVGVVSALNRNFAPSEKVYYQNMIQTDAAINPGNSGGPLVNALGEVIGINTFIYTGNNQNRGSIGIGFAIPINIAKRVVKELVKYGKRRSLWTGIAVQEFDRSDALRLGLSAEKGVLIADLEKGSPGQIAGLRERDVIVSIGKRKIFSLNDVDGSFYNYFVNDTVPFDILRGDSKLPVSLVLKENPY
jgi:serine protease Do